MTDESKLNAQIDADLRALTEDGANARFAETDPMALGLAPADPGEVPEPHYRIFEFMCDTILRDFCERNDITGGDGKPRIMLAPVIRDGRKAVVVMIRVNPEDYGMAVPSGSAWAPVAEILYGSGLGDINAGPGSLFVGNPKFRGD